MFDKLEVGPEVTAGEVVEALELELEVTGVVSVLVKAVLVEASVVAGVEIYFVQSPPKSSL